MAGEMHGMRVSVRRENDCETATCFFIYVRCGNACSACNMLGERMTVTVVGLSSASEGVYVIS